MSIYNSTRIKELATEKMKKDLAEQGYSKDNDFFKTDEEYEKFFTLDNEEFNKYLLLRNIVKDIDEWTFYTSDTVYDEIISEYTELRQMNGYFDIEECLEEAKEENIIDGFIELGGDLWIIK